MKKPRMLITGVSGFLGRYLANTFQDYADIWGTYYRYPPLSPSQIKSFQLDLQNISMTRGCIKKVNPDICFHLAALSRPDLCQKNMRLANNVNLFGTKSIVESLPKSSKLIFGSTDLVFDGQKGWYEENDATHPINHYAWTKCEAEKIVQGFQGHYCIVRFSLMFGWGDEAHQSASDWMIRSLIHHKPISLFTNQFRTIIYVEHVCQILKYVIQSGIKGILHIGGSDRISRYHFGILLCTQMGLPHELVRPVKMEEIQGEAKRGSDCSLSTKAMIQNLGIQPPGVLEGIKAMKNALNYLDEK